MKQKTTNAKFTVVIIPLMLLIGLAFASCASSKTSSSSPLPPVPGLIGMDEAIDNAVQQIETKLPNGTPVVIATITTPHKNIEAFISDELTGRFTTLVALARGDAAMGAVQEEQQYQMSGFVSDASAVSIGNFLGAKAIITGELSLFEQFTQIRLRIIDVETSEVTVYSARLANNDPILANITAPLGTAKKSWVSEEALEYFNKGKDLIREGKIDEGLEALQQAITVDSSLTDVYLYRARFYYFSVPYLNWLIANGELRKDMNVNLSIDNNTAYDLAIADCTQMLQIEPNNVEALDFRAFVYNYGKKEYDLAIADYTQMLQINQKNADAYYLRGGIYSWGKKDYNRAIADYTRAIHLEPKNAKFYYDRGNNYYYNNNTIRALADVNKAIRLDPNYAEAIYQRGFIYSNRKKDYTKGIADIETALRIKPDQTWWKDMLVSSYISRGNDYVSFLYYDNRRVKKDDYDNAIADYTEALRINPNSDVAYYCRGNAYRAKGDIERAIADHEEAVRLKPDNNMNKQALERSLQQRGK